MALCVPEMCFWPAKTSKNRELFEMHTCLWPGAQMWFRHKWRKLVTASLLLFCFGGYSYRRYWNEFLFSCVSCLRLKFSSIALWRKRLQLDPKSNLTTNGLILGFFVGFFVAFLSVWTEICNNCSLVFLFRRHQIFSIFSLKGILVCSLKKLVLFSHRNL